MPERATRETRSEKSAEAIVAPSMEQRAERDGASNGLSMSTARHQMSASAERVPDREGEALPNGISDETGLPRREPEGAGRGLLEQVFARENMQRAWKRVKANKGAAGVDGLDITQTAEHLRWAWPDLRQHLLDKGGSQYQVAHNDVDTPTWQSS